MSKLRKKFQARLSGVIEPAGAQALASERPESRKPESEVGKHRAGMEGLENERKLLAKWGSVQHVTYPRALNFDVDIGSALVSVQFPRPKASCCSEAPWP